MKAIESNLKVVSDKLNINYLTKVKNSVLYIVLLGLSIFNTVVFNWLDEYIPGDIADNTEIIDDLFLHIKVFSILIVAPIL